MIGTTADEPTPPRPWSEQNVLQRCGTILGAVIGGGFILGLLAFFLAGYLFLVMQAVVETDWALTKVDTERVCVGPQTQDCLLRMRGNVSSVTGLEYWVALDRPPYDLRVSTLPGPPPANGSPVVVEKWNGRLVSVVDPVHGRRHAEEWPRKWHDLAEGIAAAFFVLGIPGLIVWGWIAGRREQAQAAAPAEVPVP